MAKKRETHVKNCDICGKLFPKDRRLSATQWGLTYSCSRVCRAEHIKRVRHAQRPELCDVLKNYSVSENGCWEWEGHVSIHGYGTVRWRGKNYRVHAASLAQVIENPGGKMACHTCDNRKCLNPQHLYWGDSQTNARDAVSRKRNAYGEKNASAKMTWEKVRELREGKWSTFTEAAKHYGINRTTVAAIVNGKLWVER